MEKESSMLLDIQYIKANKKEGNTDYLYVIWKDLKTNEKHLQVIPEPMMDIYFEKPEFRNHSYSKNYAKLEEVEKKTVRYKDILYAIVDDMGDAGRQKLQNYLNTGNYSGLKEFFIYPYVYGADYDVRAWYRYKWDQEFHNDLPKPLTKSYLDIEVDIMEAEGMPSPASNPIDLCTIIDIDTKTSYTFALVGVNYKERDLSDLSPSKLQKELHKKAMYMHRMEEQEYWTTHLDELQEEAHNMFDENYPGMEYKFYFYKDEMKMITHIWQLINLLKKDFLCVWNISFDIPYFIERCRALGLDPKEVMCHPDFPVKECWFKKDKMNFAVKNKSDFFHCSSYTIFTDQMINYAAIRKNQSELRSNSLNNIAKKEIGDAKLDYSEQANIKTLSYTDYLMYILYNIKDVLLQTGIEERTKDLENIYMTSYQTCTPYESVFKQTVKLRNVEYSSFMSQNLVPGENVNGFLYNNTKKEKEEDEEDEDESTFEGALVGDPKLITNFGDFLFGKRTNSIFKYSIDLDMSAFYPSTIRIMNIDCSTLIFKVIIPADQYDVRGGKIPFHGITDTQINPRNNDSFTDDIAKEVLDNFQTKNYLSFGYKWLNLPSVNEVYKEVKKRLKKKG